MKKTWRHDENENIYILYTDIFKFQMIARGHNIEGNLLGKGSALKNKYWIESQSIKTLPKWISNKK